MDQILEIRIGGLREHTEIRSKIVNAAKWPKEESTGWIKGVVDGPLKTVMNGLEGDAQGAPTHLADSLNRGVLIFHEDLYDTLLEKFPESKSTLIRGGFAENFVVTGPSLHPSVVCVGDRFQVGSTIFCVSGSRFGCPKLDAWHNAQGVAEFANGNGWSGYFLRVEKEGEVCSGDTFTLLRRPHPGYTIERISRGLWGPTDKLDHSREFLTYVSNIEELIPRHFRDAATLRLQRLNEREAEDDVQDVKPVKSKENDKNKDSRNVYMMSVLILVLAVMFFTFSPSH